MTGEFQKIYREIRGALIDLKSSIDDINKRLDDLFIEAEKEDIK